MTTTIHHACGHEVEYDGAAPPRERPEEPCRDCRYARAAAEARAENAAAGLPALTGSAKQVAWAEVLRARWRTASVAEPYSPDDFTGRLEEAREAAEEANRRLTRTLARILGHREASWWIGHRTMLPAVADLRDRILQEVEDEVAYRGAIKTTRRRKSAPSIDWTQIGLMYPQLPA